MPDQVITVLSAGDFLSTVSSNLDVMAGIFSRYFPAPTIFALFPLF